MLLMMLMLRPDPGTVNLLCCVLSSLGMHPGLRMRLPMDGRRLDMELHVSH